MQLIRDTGHFFAAQGAPSVVYPLRYTSEGGTRWCGTMAVSHRVDRRHGQPIHEDQVQRWSRPDE
ncbi:MAG: hypothetical protein R3233_06960 [Xanthomonadales bacterium]|nr:hypothetical protein [Xanthomonadales bacterium]